MVIQEIRMFSFMETIILKTQSQLGYSPILCQESAIVLRLITLASLSTPPKNQQPVSPCGEN